jgi:hypothetical protein
MKATERQFYLAVILILTAVIFTQRACSRPKPCNCDEVQIVQPVQNSKIDSSEAIKPDSNSWHKPKLILEQSESPRMASKPLADTSIQLVAQKPNLDSLRASDWALVRYYEDSSHFDAGDVVVRAIVKNNRLGSLRVLPTFKQKTVTIEKTVTQTIQAKPRGQVYFGLIASGDQKDLLTGFGVSTLYKSKRDKIWSASVLYDRILQEPVYQVGTYFKLSLKRH